MFKRFVNSGPKPFRVHSFCNKLTYIFVFRFAVRHFDCLMLVLNVAFIQDAGVLESRNQPSETEDGSDK